MRVPVRRHPGGDGEDEVPVEEPLEIRVEGEPVAITMRSPGDDLDLVAGFLFTEGVVDGPDDVRAMAEVAENTVDVRLAEGVPAARARSADRALYATSSCGVCGKASLDRLLRDVAPARAWTPSPEVLGSLPARLRAAQPGFGVTGGVHAAALFDARGELLVVREDVGRHNAVDKVLGARFRADALDFDALGLVVSSRAGFEIVQKALVARVPVVAALGAPTSLAVEAARSAGMVLVGWLRGDRFNVY
ncbi:MAG: formate dehydrogenase accessory sulfurtransferase FdhD [Myxococcota bacterium]